VDESGCDFEVSCPGILVQSGCGCVCPSGYTQIKGECYDVFSTPKLEANIKGKGITTSFHYAAEDVDIEFKGDTLIVDGYIDHQDPAKSAYIYIRIVDGNGGQIKSDTSYDLSVGGGLGKDFASHKYPFEVSNEVYSVDTGSIYINDIDAADGLLDATFSFSCKTSGGDYRFIDDGWVKTAEKKE